MLQFKKILYPTDFSQCANKAFTHAVYLARKFQAELHMLNAVILHDNNPHDPASLFPHIEPIHNKLTERGQEKMGKIKESCDVVDIRVKKIIERGIAPAHVILEYARENDIDLIVMGTHGRRGIGHLFIGSVAEEVVRFADCSVLTIKEAKDPQAIESLNNILVPTDFSDYAQHAFTYAKEIASFYGAKLQLLHVIEQTALPSFYEYGEKSIYNISSNIRDKTKEAMERMLKETKGPEVKIETHIIEGHAAKDIINFTTTHDIDLIVIATHGLSGIEHLLLGSITEKVVRFAPCPVFTVKTFSRSV